MIAEAFWLFGFLMLLLALGSMAFMVKVWRESRRDDGYDSEVLKKIEEGGKK